MGQVNYSASKAGDIGFTKALAQENARKGITVNAICPGYIATEMVMAVAEVLEKRILPQIPVGRLGQPQIEVLRTSADAQKRWIRLRVPVDEGQNCKVGTFEAHG